MESSIAEFLLRQLAYEQLPTSSLQKTISANMCLQLVRCVSIFDCVSQLEVKSSNFELTQKHIIWETISAITAFTS